MSEFPPLWDVCTSAKDDTRLVNPRTRVQSFKLGYQSAVYAQCGDDACRAQCLVAAAAALGLAEPLTPNQLMTAPEILKTLDEERSVGDRVRGFFSFVNVVWIWTVLDSRIVCVGLSLV